MCGGGGGSDTVDEAYNARIATIAEQAAGWAGEDRSFWEYGTTYDPTESVTGYYDSSGNFQEVDPATWKASQTSGIFKNLTGSTDPNYDPNIELITTTRGELSGYDSSTPSYMDMELAQIASNMEAMPYQTQQAISESKYATQAADSASSLLPDQTALRSALNQETLSNIALRQPVTAKYYDEALNGIDVGQRMNQASADVAGALKNATSDSIRNMSRYGINPNSGRGKSALSENSLSAANMEVGARQAARSSAETENFNRLSDATALSSQQSTVY